MAAIIWSGRESLEAAKRLTLVSHPSRNPLADPSALLAIIEVDDANAMLKLVQHPHNFTRSDMTIHVVDDMGAGSLGNQRLQTFPRDRIHVDAKNPDAPLRTA